MKIQLVDEQDNIIGTKERSELDYTKDMYRVSALWLTNLSGQALIAQRTLKKDKDPGRWGPAVAGTIDAGETYEENIYKEAFEEIGLEGVTFKEGPKFLVTKPRRYYCQWYFAQVDLETSAFTLQVEEVDQVAWIDIQTLKDEIRQMPDKYIAAMPQVLSDLSI